MNGSDNKKGTVRTMNYLAMPVFAVLLLVSPVFARVLGVQLGGLATAVLVVSGALLLLITGVLTTVRRLYQKTKASEAFVRTGFGGVRVIRDGGALVIPFVHELVRVSLQTIKLEVQRENEVALITKDKLRADIRAEFFVRVQPDVESILQASRSLGEKMLNLSEVRALVEDKLVSALRTAAASRTLEELNSERDQFLSDVMRLVGEDLSSNGLVLETVTISKLDQTDDRFLKAENIFDAQGKRKIAEITQQNLSERNRLVREGEQLRKQQDVIARQAVLELERRENETIARQHAEVQKSQAEAARDAEVKSLEAKREVELASIEKQRQLEVATRLAEQAAEIAEREKQEKIVEAEQKRTLAQRALVDAEAERERAQQALHSVRVTAEAERDKTQKVLAAQAQAEMRFVNEQRQADSDAYAKQKQAEAQRLAADAEAEAVRKRAQAQADAEHHKALGQRAIAMVPVEVKRAELDVERDRVENVVKRELEAREKHGRVAQEFELSKLRIEAEREVRVATAHAQASLFTKMSANLYGTTADVEKLMQAFVNGQGTANLLNGFVAQVDQPTKAALRTMGEGVAQLAESVLDARNGHAKAKPAAQPLTEE
jgi:flotillin